MSNVFYCACHIISWKFVKKKSNQKYLKLELWCIKRISQNNCEHQLWYPFCLALLDFYMIKTVVLHEACNLNFLFNLLIFTETLSSYPINAAWSSAFNQDLSLTGQIQEFLIDGAPTHFSEEKRRHLSAHTQSATCLCKTLRHTRWCRMECILTIFRILFLAYFSSSPFRTTHAPIGCRSILIPTCHFSEKFYLNDFYSEC